MLIKVIKLALHNNVLEAAVQTLLTQKGLK